MDGSVLVSVDGSLLIDGLSNDVDNSSQSLRTDGNLNRIASVEYFLPSNESFSGIESNSSDVAATKMLGDFEHQSVVGALDLHSIENGREFSLKPVSYTHLTLPTIYSV